MMSGLDTVREEVLPFRPVMGVSKDKPEVARRFAKREASSAPRR